MEHGTDSPSGAPGGLASGLSEERGLLARARDALRVKALLDRAVQEPSPGRCVQSAHLGEGWYVVSIEAHRKARAASVAAKASAELLDDGTLRCVRIRQRRGKRTTRSP